MITEVAKIVFVGVVCSVLCVTVRQYRPDFVPVIQVAGIIGVVVLLSDYLKNMMSAAADLIGITDVIDDGYVKILVKILGIAILTRVGADICADSGNSAIADNVELAGKVIILMMCMSFVRVLISAAGDLSV